MTNPADAARAAATEAAERSGVRVRALESVADVVAADELFREVWRTGTEAPPIAADVLRSLADADNYVAGAFDLADPGRMVGGCVGFWTAPGQVRLHSHLAGVHSSARGRSVGLALKLDQRAYALERGVGTITWTFDPLVARNAHFNLRTLGGTADTYLIDHYGRLADGLNGDDPTDRLMLRWDLAAGRRAPRTGPPPPAVLVADGDRPNRRAVEAAQVLVGVPPEVEDLRRRDPAAARAWRSAVRDVLEPLLADGARLVDFDRAAGGYLLDRGAR